MSTLKPSIGYFDEIPGSIYDKRTTSENYKFWKTLEDPDNGIQTAMLQIKFIHVIAKMTGVNLNNLGALLDVTRGGKSDETYRVFLIAAIGAADASIFTANSIFSLVSGANNILYNFISAGVYRMSGTDFNPAVDEADIVSIMEALSGAGIRLDIVKGEDNYFGFNEDPTANTFGDDTDVNIGGVFTEII